MSLLYLILPLALLLAAIAVAAFLWAARRGQFDDLETPAHRMLHDDEPARDDKGDAEAGEKRGSAGSDARA